MDRKFRKISTVLFCSYIVAVVLLCVIRTDSLPELPKSFLGIPLDKITHFVMFLPFPVLGYTTFYPTEQGNWRKFAVLGIMCVLGFAFAYSTERLQAFTSYRACETADLIARPSIASHKGGLVPIWAAGAVTSSWNDPSSSGQLPVPVALNARPPTLFGAIIHER